MEPRPPPLKSKEAVAKLLCPEKSMILRPFERRCFAEPVHSDDPNPEALGEENELKWPQKGGFAGQMSFAIASKL